MVSPEAQPPPTVTQALVHAASVLSTRDRVKPKQMLSLDTDAAGTPKLRVLGVDMRPLVIHLLEGLQRAGITRAVVTLGEAAASIEAAVQAYPFKSLKVDFLYSSRTLWYNLTSSIIAARAAFPGNEPLLIVRADQLYDWRLLRKIAEGNLAHPHVHELRQRSSAIQLRPTARATLSQRRSLRASTHTPSSTPRERHSIGRPAHTAATTARMAAATLSPRYCAVKAGALFALATGCRAMMLWSQGTSTQADHRSSSCSHGGSRSQFIARSRTMLCRRLRRTARWAASRWAS